MNIFIACLLSLTACACQTQRYQVDSIAPDASGAGVQQQVIIKFKSHAVACNAADLARFSAQTRIPLQYIRPMSGDACVVRQTARNQEALLEGQRILKNLPAIEWLEEDRIMKTLR